MYLLCDIKKNKMRLKPSYLSNILVTAFCASTVFGQDTIQDTNKEPSLNDKFKIASSYLAKNDLAKAKMLFNRLLKDTCKEDSVSIASIYYNLGIIATKEENYNDALKYYYQVCNLRKGSRIAEYSEMAINSINKRLTKAKVKYTKTLALNDNPLELTIPITLSKDGLPQLNILVNNIATKAVFDSGASDFIISKPMAYKFGIDLNKSKPDIEITGSGSKKNNNAFSNKVDFQCDLIHWTEFPVLITNENFPLIPVLGSNCLNNYDYFLDKENLKLHLTLKNNKNKLKTDTIPVFDKFSLDSKCKYQFAVPFFFDKSNLIVVTAKINDVDCPMTLDTGASTSLFTYETIKKYNLKLALLNDKDVHWGVNGNCQSQTCNINTFKLGPMVLHNLKASVTNQSNAKRPLLGSDVFYNWIINVDKQNMVITFKQD